MKTPIRVLKGTIPVLLLLSGVLFLFGNHNQPTLWWSKVQTFINGQQYLPPLRTTTTTSSNVYCNPLQSLSMGTGTGSSTFDECVPDTIVLSTNAVTGTNASTDNQEMVFHDLCGAGEFVVKLSALSGGYAGVFVRESNAAGARKCAYLSQLGSQLFLQKRTTNNFPFFQSTFSAPSHQWLKITRSGNYVSGFWSTNGINWNLSFFTLQAMTDCVEIGVAAYSTSSGTTIDATFTDISFAQGDTVPDTEVMFADTLINADAGDTVQVCVNLENPCYCGPTSVDVVLNTDSLPHFIGYQTQTLTFEENDTTQCFSIVLEHADSTKTYSLNLANVQGGYQANAGTPASLDIVVEGQEPPAPTFAVCGSFYKTPPTITDSTALLFSDRFGNLYLEEELELPPPSQTLLPSSSCGCDEFTDLEVPWQSENYFELYFQDCITPTNPPSGFADPTLGEARRRVACKAFAYLAHLIQRSEDPCDEEHELPPVNIEVVSFNNQDGILATGSPYFEGPFYEQEGGIIDGLAWKMINNPGYYNQNPAPENFFHGKFTLNVAYEYFLEDSENIDADKFDLYTVALHEGLHILGFLSLAQINTGDPYVFLDMDGNENVVLRSYSRFDTHLALEFENTTPFVVRDAIDPYTWILNPLIDVSTDLHSSCTNISGPQMNFVTHDGNTKYPIYTGGYTDDPNTPENDEANQSTSFSHLHINCSNPPDEYLMYAFINKGTRLDLAEDGEKRILCELGYQLSGMSNCSCSVAGNHDPVKACTDELFEFTICDEESTELIIDLDDLLGNDVGADGVTDLVVFDADDQIVNNQNGTLSLTVCFPGIHSFKYTPISSTCPQEGNPVIVTVLVKRCEDCEFFSTENEVPKNNNCNLICNPHLTAYEDGQLVGLDSVHGISCGVNCFDFPGWFKATVTPDFFGNESQSANSGSIRMRAKAPIAYESTYAPISLEGGRYFFSYYSKGRNNPTSSDTFKYKINIELIDQDFKAQFGDCTGFPLHIEDVDFNIGERSTISSTQFENPVFSNFVRDISCLDIPSANNYSAIWFWPEITLPGDGAQQKNIYLDEVEVIPDDFTAGADQIFVCDSLYLGGIDFCMLSDLEVRYTWKDDEDNTLLEYTVEHTQSGTTLIDSIPVDTVNIPVLAVFPTQTTTYTLMREVVTSGFDDFAACFEDEDEVVVTFVATPPTATLNLDSEDCGLATFSISGLQAGETWEINYGDGTTGSSLQHNYSTSVDTFTATLSVTNPCGTTQSTVVVEVEGCSEALCCPISGSIFLSNNITITEAIAAGLPSGSTGQDLCIEDTLTIDQDYAFTGNLYMGPDAAIVVDSLSTLELDGAHLQGCDFLWAGIIVQKPRMNGGFSLISHNQTIIEDAKKGIDAANKVLLDITKTTFDRNYIGMNLVDVSISGFYGNTFDCTTPLTPPLDTTEAIGTYGYVGINSLRGILHIGVAGATVNTFQNLRNGIFNEGAILTVENSVFYDLEKGVDEPYDYTGYGIRHYGTSYAPLIQKGLGSTALIPTFENCYTGVWANFSNVNVRSNRMDNMYIGVHIENSKDGVLKISQNKIDCFGIGISLLQNDPAQSIDVVKNIIYVDQTSLSVHNGWGIDVNENGGEQINARIRQNDIYLYQENFGLYLNTTNKYTIEENEVFLVGTTANNAVGVSINNSTNCRVSCNEVTGIGKGFGIVSHYTSSTLFTCNTVENLTTGTAFGGASSDNELKNTVYIPPFSQGLLYEANIQMMPIQSHRGNRWELGSYGVAAAVHLGNGPPAFYTEQGFIINTTSPPTYPPTIALPNSSGATGTDWFRVFPGTSATCSPTSECSLLGFVPIKEEIRTNEEQLAVGDFANTWSGGLHWAAQWQLYKMLETAASIRDTSTVMATYYSSKGTAALGRLYHLHKNLDTLFQLLPTQRAALQQNLQQTDSLMEALILADSVLINHPGSAVPGLTKQLLAQCDSLLILLENLVDTLQLERAAFRDSLYVQNASISDTAVYQSNEKWVNGISLNTLFLDSLGLDSLQADTLYNIALQCPEYGGPAVYRARSLYGLYDKVNFDTITCQSSASRQSLPAVPYGITPPSEQNPTFQVFPNPNNGNFTVTYELPQNATLRITDLTGRTVKTIELFADTQRQEIIASELNPGLYYLQVVSEQHELLHSQRIVIY